MATHVEYQLLSRIIDYQDFASVQRAGITEEFFYEAMCKQVFQFLQSHYVSRYTYGSIPSWDIVLQRYPAFQRVNSNDTVDTLCEQLHREQMAIQIRSLADSLYQMVQTDPRECLDMIRSAATTLSTQHEASKDLLMSDAYEPLLREYELVASGQGLLGIPWPWQIVNEETQGLQGGQFIVLFGRPGMMKTWVGLVIAVHAYLQARQRVLLISMEMDNENIQRRALSICAKVDYEKLRKATLQPHDKERVFQWLQHLKSLEQNAKNTNGHHPSFLATSGIGWGVGQIRSKINEFRPDLVVVDGLYRCKDDRTKSRSIDWKNVTNIAQDLNEVAKSLKIPLIGITQANRGAAKSSPKDADISELAFADALGQECDMAIRVKKEKDPQTHENEIVLSFPKTREYEVANVVIHGHPGINFDFKRLWIPQAQDPNTSNGSGSGNKNGAQTGGRQTVVVTPNSFR